LFHLSQNPVRINIQSQNPPGGEGTNEG
jgi:hypothetical protein